MKPAEPLWSAAVSRRSAMALGLSVVVGCAGPAMRSQSPDVDDIAAVDDGVKLVGDLTGPWGLHYEKVEAIALITELRGTGSDPPADDRREALREEMKLRGVKHPDDILVLDSTSLALVRAWLPPNVQKGDRLDIDVTLPNRSQTTSLRGGWLMPTRLAPMEVLQDARIHTGHVSANAQGPVLVEALFSGEGDKSQEKRGRVLGGGVSLKTRTVGLVIRGDNYTQFTTSLLGAAINRRFYANVNGRKAGVATPKNDKYIELAVPTQYRHSLGRYMRVVRSIAVRESNHQRLERIQSLELMLLQPTTSAKAALRLEAIGREATPILRKGLESADPEVRFYAAEALAYLDEADAAPVLAAAARTDRAFRWHALTALSTVNHVEAYDALTELLHVPSVETRYGALIALRERNPHDPLAQGEVLGNTLRLIRIPSEAEPVVHVSRTRKPEIVVFGADARLATPLAISLGRNLLVKGLPDGMLEVIRFGSGDDDRREICEPKVTSLARTLVSVGASYADVWTALKDAKRQNALLARLEVDAMPRPNRLRQPDASSAEASEEEQSEGWSASPLPNLFFGRSDDDEGRGGPAASDPLLDEDSPAPAESKTSFFGRMTKWFKGD